MISVWFLILQIFGSISSFSQFKVKIDGNIKNDDKCECENGWTKPSLISRTCYRLFSSKVTWDEARLYCQNLKAELASVTSSITNKFLTTLTHNQCWIGGYKDGSTWQWTDGSTWEYTNWSNGQPDNLGGKQDKLQFNFGGLGKWDDVEGDHYKPGLPFICEKQSGSIGYSNEMYSYHESCAQSNKNVDNQKTMLILCATIPSLLILFLSISLVIFVKKGLICMENNQNK